MTTPHASGVAGLAGLLLALALLPGSAQAAHRRRHPRPAPCTVRDSKTLASNAQMRVYREGFHRRKSHDQSVGAIDGPTTDVGICVRRSGRSVVVLRESGPNTGVGLLGVKLAGAFALLNSADCGETTCLDTLIEFDAAQRRVTHTLPSGPDFSDSEWGEFVLADNGAFAAAMRAGPGLALQDGAGLRQLDVEATNLTISTTTLTWTSNGQQHSAPVTAPGATVPAGPTGPVGPTGPAT